MRLLAYGGNAFQYRARLGNWPEIPESSLSDYYGIPGTAVSFGLVNAGGRPCLLYRERQNLEPRGGYPFALLIDPGEASDREGAWGKAGWNAAALLVCLLGAHSEWRSALLDPDRLSLAQLREILAAAAQSEFLVPYASDPPEGQPMADSGANWIALLCGSVTKREPARDQDKDVVVANLSSLQASARPDPETVAGWLRLAPAWVRFGGGWIVGGSTGLASVFGSRVVLDDGQRSAEANPSAVIERGREMLRLVSELHHDPATAGLMKQYAGLSPLEWSDRVDEILTNAVSVLKASREEDSAFEHGLPADKEAAAQMWKRLIAMLGRCQASGKQLRPYATRTFLENNKLKETVAAPQAVPAEYVAALDPQELNNFLDREAIPPRVSAVLSLPADLSMRRCLASLARLAVIDRPAVDAHVAMLKQLGGGALEPEFLASAFELWNERGNKDLLSWWGVHKGERIARLLGGEARRQISERAQGWLAEGILFCPAELSRLLAGNAEGLEEACIDLCGSQMGRPYSTELKQWLDKLAGSELRENLGIGARAKICALGLKSWQRFAPVVMALAGDGHELAKLPKKDRDAYGPEVVKLMRHILESGDSGMAPDAASLWKAYPRDEQIAALAELLGKKYPATWGAALRKVEGGSTRPNRAAKSAPGGKAQLDLLPDAADDVSLDPLEAILEDSQRVRPPLPDLRGMEEDGYPFEQVGEEKWEALVERVWAGDMVHPEKAKCSDVGIDDPWRVAWWIAYGCGLMLAILGGILVSPWSAGVWRAPEPASNTAPAGPCDALPGQSCPAADQAQGGSNSGAPLTVVEEQSSAPSGGAAAQPGGSHKRRTPKPQEQPPQAQDSTPPASQEGQPTATPATQAAGSHGTAGQGSPERKEHRGYLNPAWRLWVVLPLLAAPVVVVLARLIWPPMARLAITRHSFNNAIAVVELMCRTQPDVFGRRTREVLEVRLSVPPRGAALPLLPVAILYFAVRNPAATARMLGEKQKRSVWGVRRAAHGNLTRLGFLRPKDKAHR